MFYNSFSYFNFDIKLAQALSFSLGNLGFSESHCLIESVSLANKLESIEENAF